MSKKTSSNHSSEAVKKSPPQANPDAKVGCDSAGYVMAPPPPLVKIRPPEIAFAVTDVGTVTHLIFAGDGFDANFDVKVTELIIGGKTWSLTDVQAMRGGTVLGSKFKVTSGGPTVPTGESGQVDITVTTSGSANPPNVPIYLSLPSVYVGDIT